MCIGADDGVGVCKEDELMPSDVGIDQSRASPLSGFEDDDAHRLTSFTLSFELLQAISLAVIETEWNASVVSFFLDAQGGESPVFKVVEDAHRAEFTRVHLRVEAMVVCHCDGEIQLLFQGGEIDAFACADASFASERIVVCIHNFCFLTYRSTWNGID